MSFSGGAQPLLITVSDLISEHTLISGHPHFVLVEIIARACRDLCVLAVLLRCNRYLMLINHPTDGATCVFCVI